MNNGQAPATKQDLADLKTELLAADARLKDELMEAIRKVETNLLAAVFGYTESIQKHFTDLDRSDNSIRERLATLENRFLDLERHVKFPGFNP